MDNVHRWLTEPEKWLRKKNNHKVDNLYSIIRLKTRQRVANTYLMVDEAYQKLDNAYQKVDKVHQVAEMPSK